jgi:D-lyxose ketol-isomerase
MMLVKSVPLIFFVLCMLACQNEGKWYPDAEVVVKNSVEYTDPVSGTKALLVTLVITNTSHSSITASTLTLHVRTDKQEYLHTAGSTVRIIPGGTIAVQTSVAYLSPEEQLAPDGVTLYDAFFD